MIIGSTHGGVARPGDQRLGILPNWNYTRSLNIACHQITMPYYPATAAEMDYFYKSLVSAKSKGLTQAIIEIELKPSFTIEKDHYRDSLKAALKNLPYPPLAIKVGNEPDATSDSPSAYLDWLLFVYPIISSFGIPVIMGGIAFLWDWWNQFYADPRLTDAIKSDLVFDIHVLGSAAELPSKMASSLDLLDRRLGYVPPRVCCSEVGSWSGASFYPGGAFQTETQQGKAIIRAFEEARKRGVWLCCGALWPKDTPEWAEFEHWGLWTAQGREKTSAAIIRNYVKNLK